MRPRKHIADSELQEHMHTIGLEAFLRQLEEVFGDAHHDMRDFDNSFISKQYDQARWEMNAIRHRIFPSTTKD